MPSWDCYKRQLQRSQLLSPAEVGELMERYRTTHDPAIVRKLVEANQRLVAKIAFRYMRRDHRDMLDLIQEGNLGLLLAIERFDPGRGVRLATFAAWWIRAYQLRYIVKSRCLVRIGTTEQERSLFFKVGQAERRVARSGQPVTDEAIADVLRVPVPRLAEFRSRLVPAVSLHAPVDGARGMARQLLEVLPQQRIPAPDSQVEEEEERATIARVIERISPQLSERERVLLEDRLLSLEPRSLEEIGQQFHLSRERVRQIEQELLGKLRAHPALGDLGPARTKARSGQRAKAVPSEQETVSRRCRAKLPREWS